MVIRADDLLTWIDHGQVWQWGLQAATVQPVAAITPSKNGSSGERCEEDVADKHVPTLKNTKLDFTDVDIEKGKLVVT